MSFVIATPEMVSAAAADLASIGSTINAASAAAALPTTSVLAAGADEVSAVIAALFGAHAQAYQRLSAQATAFHTQFVHAMSVGSGAYAAAESFNAQQSLLSAINAPSIAMFQRPLIGNGAPGAPGTGNNGADAGILIGNGGAGGSGAPGKDGGRGGAAGLLFGNGGHGGDGGGSNAVPAG
ncbi:PE family protein, partial [Mycobacterium szulgai]